MDEPSSAEEKVPFFFFSPFLSPFIVLKQAVASVGQFGRIVACAAGSIAMAQSG